LWLEFCVMAQVPEWKATKGLNMAIEQKFTDLPQASNANLTDIICAVQNYVDPNNLGLSVQLTLNQILQLVQSSTILYNAGNPNGQVAGTTYMLCWDTVNKILWVCTISGTALTALWTKSIQLTAGTGITITQNGDDIEIASSNVLANFIEVPGTSQQMAVDTTYQPINVSPTTLTLPATADLGQIVRVTGWGTGGWIIAQNLGQQIIVGNTQTTVGVSGSVSSTNRYDGIELVCTDINVTWQAVVAPQGMLNIV